ARKNFAKYLFGSAAALGLLGGEVFAFGRLDEIDVVECDALLLGETDSCTCRRADCIVSDGLRRPSDFADHVSLLNFQSTDMSRESARSAEGFDRRSLG